MNYFCCTDTRRAAVKQHPVLNGIDFLEVMDNVSDPYNERQTTLFVHFIKPLVPGSISTGNLDITGGERIRQIQVISAVPEPEVSFPSLSPEERAKVLMVKVAAAGDFSTYTLRLVRGSGNETPPHGFDPVLAAVSFSFRVLCANDFDCQPVADCTPLPDVAPEINYLAKDYAGFRRLMLDRMALLAPGWKENSPADAGIMLVELLAYAADSLSYRQDALATEAYLQTSRKRISVRRHARLIDYFMHDGCNARTWLQIQAGPGANGLLLEKGKGADRTRILTKTEGLPPVLRPDTPEYLQALGENVTVFELMHDIRLYTAHNKMSFYTWGSKECILPKGATSATLKGHFPGLAAGDVLILSEVRGPVTGVLYDADPTRRHAVKLTSVILSEDVLYKELPQYPGSDAWSPGITEIKWDAADALPFSLCISNHQGIGDISIACGNIVLADHGLTINDTAESPLRPAIVPEGRQLYAGPARTAGNCCGPVVAEAVPVRFSPALLAGPLTFAAPFDRSQSPSATGCLRWSVRNAEPWILLRETGAAAIINDAPLWMPVRDLLNSAADKKVFVVETESDSIAYLRFGNNINGARPVSGTVFAADYRIGNGTAGNIGAGTLAHIATGNAAVIANLQQAGAVSNPLPAVGGMAAETIEEVQQYAPDAFRTQQRAVTAADYEVFAAECSPDVQRAAATFRWTGSWQTVFLSIDRSGGAAVDKNFKNGLRSGLEKFRMAGFDLEIDTPVYVSLEIGMIICVAPAFFASDVENTLLQLFSSGNGPDGRPGIFHPDNFSFGQTVYLSRLYAAAQATPGVTSVQITKFQRQGNDSNVALASGKLLLGRREIARLDNDRNFPERGVFHLIMKGGRS